MLHRFFPARIVFVLCAALLSAPASTAHEFWIEPEAFVLPKGAQLSAHFKNGEMFRGIKLGYFEKRSKRLDYAQGPQADPITPRLGDVPAITLAPPGDGLLVLAHETSPQTITYDSWEDFAAFARHKDFSDIAARHDDRGLPRTGFDEEYTRHAKALVGVGSAAGRDRPMGLETEFVALTNPYTDPVAEGVRIALLYDGEPRPDAQIEVFARAPDGTVTVSMLRTDREGHATVPVTAGYDYLLDAVVLRKGSWRDSHAWETLWAALTFHVPDLIDPATD